MSIGQGQEPWFFELEQLATDTGSDRVKAEGKLNEALFLCQSKLDHLATCFRYTGNAKMYSDLRDMSLILGTVAGKYTEITSKSLTEQLHTAQDMSGAILRATLAGCVIGREHAEKTASDETATEQGTP